MHIPLTRYLSLLKTYLRPLWRSTAALAVLLLSGIGLQLLNPQIVRFFIDTALKGGATLSLVYAGLLFIAVALVNQGIAVAVSYLGTNIAWTSTNLLRTDLVAHCLTLEMGFHKARTPGEMIERVDGDVDNLSNFFSQFVLSLITNILLLLGILVLFFLIHWLIGVAMTMFSILMLLILVYLRRKVVPLWKAERQMSATFYGFLGERLGGTEDIRANGATGYTMRRFYLLLREWFPILRRAVLMGNFIWIFTLSVFVCAIAMVLGLGTYLWSIGQMSIGTIYLLYSYTDLLLGPLQQIQTQLQDLQQAEACIERIEELFALSSSLLDGKGSFPAHMQRHVLPVEFRHVTFGYVPEEPVIHDLSFTLAPGKVLGVLGRTGSGKTTLARLLFRLYDPQEGEVCVGGVAVRDVQLRELRRQIGMVTQDVQLFHASVRDNLTFFNRTITDERILAALAEVGLLSWYETLAEGLDTVLGSDGEGLSAGEAQLLAFTRVLLTDPGLVILDEASSRLDPATEGVIERALAHLFSGRTALVIAHRLATIQHVDEILIIEDGRVVEAGRREVLAADPSSHFAQLLRTGLEETTLEHKEMEVGR